MSVFASQKNDVCIAFQEFHSMVGSQYWQKIYGVRRYIFWKISKPTWDLTSEFLHIYSETEWLGGKEEKTNPGSGSCLPLWHEHT